MKRRRKCYYYCNGYCFYYGDTGEVCDTDNNSHDGYCPKKEEEQELEEHANAIMGEMNNGRK